MDQTSRDQDIFQPVGTLLPRNDCSRQPFRPATKLAVSRRVATSERCSARRETSEEDCGGSQPRPSNNTLILDYAIPGAQPGVAVLQEHSHWASLKSLHTHPLDTAHAVKKDGCVEEHSEFGLRFGGADAAAAGAAFLRPAEALFSAQLPGTPFRVDFALTHSKQRAGVRVTRNSFRGFSTHLPLVTRRPPKGILRNA